MFAWAATGSPFVDPDSEMITVCSFLLPTYLFLPRHWQINIVDEGDELYAGNHCSNEILMMQGVICFKTCAHNVRLPGPYIARLAGGQYPPLEGNEPQDFTQAFDHWLLCQILTAIGSHTII